MTPPGPGRWSWRDATLVTAPVKLGEIRGRIAARYATRLRLRARADRIVRRHPASSSARTVVSAC